MNKTMSAPTTPADLLDLKMMPAWVNEPARTNDYAEHEGEEERPFDRAGRGPRRERESRPRPPKNREERERAPRGGPRRPEQRRPERPVEARREREAPAPLPQVAVRFIPHPAAFESVIAQMKSGTVTYSVFALARLFLDKPERYDVHLTGSAETPLFQLGENGPVATDRRPLEGSAFANAKEEFYTIEVTQSEAIKGNFTNVARDRASGVLLGPTNHHSYQPKLRSLYEQRYSRRMSFSDFQRGIEIVSDPAVVEAWKEQARNVTTYTAKDVEPPVTFTSAAEAERHFQQTYLPQLLRTSPEFTISGVVSRRLPDRPLGRLIEDAWSAEIRSPSKMMQELAGGLRPAGLNIFRHRKGMLFVSPLRIRSFNHESTGVSASINAILNALAEAPLTNRKQLAEKLVGATSDAAEGDRVKLSLASDLRWLISEGYVIEFNDGSLDLPRAKAPPTPSVKPAAEEGAHPQSEVAARASAVGHEQMVDFSAPAPDVPGESEVEQSVSALNSADESSSAEEANAPPAQSEEGIAKHDESAAQHSDLPAETVPSPS